MPKIFAEEFLIIERKISELPETKVVFILKILELI